MTSRSDNFDIDNAMTGAMLDRIDKEIKRVSVAAASLGALREALLSACGASGFAAHMPPHDRSDLLRSFGMALDAIVDDLHMVVR